MLNKGVSSSPKQASGDNRFSRACFTFSISPFDVESNNSSSKDEKKSVYFFVLKRVARKEKKIKILSGDFEKTFSVFFFFWKKSDHQQPIKSKETKTSS